MTSEDRIAKVDRQLARLRALIIEEGVNSREDPEAEDCFIRALGDCADCGGKNGDTATIEWHGFHDEWLCDSCNERRRDGVIPFRTVVR